ncbi:MAG: type II toxin-antitoxin system HigB family toxin [Bryobacteraceae bacterium]
MREFGKRFPEAAEPLKRWANAFQAAEWNGPGALKAGFGSADFAGDLTVFNVGGNKYRLTAFVHYRRQIVHIKRILTHEEYDEGGWKR